MFSVLGRFSNKYRYFILAGWVILTAVMVVAAPQLSEVGVTDQSQFLPENSESTIARNLLDTKFAASDDSVESSAVIVVYNEAGLGQPDIDRARSLHDWLISSEGPAAVQKVTSIFGTEALRSTLVSQDNTAMLMTVELSTPSLDDATKQAVAAIRARVADIPETNFYVTGDAGLLIDLFESVQNAIDRTTLVTIVLVIILLLIVYRSPLASLVPLVTIGISYLVTRGVAGFMAQAGVPISTVVDAYLVVTVFGVGTDYCLFIVSRFKEELKQGDRALTIDTTMRRIGPVILASAVTVVVAFLCLSISSFSMTRTNGWILAIGIVVVLAAGLTLVPAMMSLFGRYLFWPMMAAPTRRERRFGWRRTGQWVSRHPMAIAVPIIILLALPYIAFSNFRLSANLLAQLPQEVDAAQGLDVFREHFSVGELVPIHLVVRSNEGSLLTSDSLRGIENVATVMSDVEGIAGADYFSASSGQIAELAGQVRGVAESFSGATSFDVTRLIPLQTIPDELEELAVRYSEILQSPSFTGAVEILQQLPTAVTQLRSTPATKLPGALQQFQESLYGLGDSLALLSEEFKLESNGPFVDWLKASYFSSDGSITRIDLMLDLDPYSDESSAAVRMARLAAPTVIEASGFGDSSYYVGGDPAIRYDILQTSESDFIRVLIFASIGIFLVIIVLLRSLLAPFYMVITVLFNFGTTMGITTWLFLNVLDVEYLVYLMPSLVFIMLAAVGADYNIFLVSRIREEAERYPVKTSVQNAVAHTGGVITSCGIILAGTFATLGTSSLPVMYEIGVPIAIGVLIDTFVVRALLVPSLATLTGRRSWWPSRLSRKS